MEIKNQLLNLKPYQPGKPIEEVKKEYGLSKIVKLASNENPFGTSQKAREAVQRELTQLGIYPDGYSAVLRNALAAHLGRKGEEIILGNGSDEVVQIICRALLKPGTNTVMAVPTFPQYKHNAVIEGAEIKEVPLVDGKHDLDAMLKEMNSETKVVWVCSPNNPTGTHVSKLALEQFLSKVPNHVLVVLDEAYFEYAVAEDYPDTLSYLDTYSNVMVLRTFSKAYGLAALRIGYGVAGREFIASIEPAREPFNTNRVAQAAAAAALEDQDFIRYCKEENRKGLQQFYDFCDETGLSYYPSEGNFILIHFGRNADELFQALLEKGYIVRAGTALGFPESLRITIGTREQNADIIEVLGKLVNRE
ncbi:histidinol-phosphate transaminase [Bacillus lacus]|uniref:Histidinol-phosphate aminotransferase n=1 Tax=Metabacillus lacus TaxID=1983721 RepID=A0A7X2IWM8_9BACI|nr:histidinol-phosphate transaminase [Metabacillus lacus]MRX70990.1 histidinol-phosphate transaminase [Metabacillus lacus]